MMVEFLSRVYDAVKADAALKALIDSGLAEQGLPASSTPLPVYLSKAPPNTRTPYLTYNTVAEPAFDTSDSLGVEPTFDVHVWAAMELLARQMLERVGVILTDPALSLSQSTLVHCRRTNSRCEAEGEDFHGVATFRAIISN